MKDIRRSLKSWASMDNLHDEMVMEIFSRLPVNSILECVQVCKTWRTLIRNTCFISNHYRRQLKALQQFGDDDHQKLDHSIISQGHVFLVKKGNYGLGYVDENYDYETHNIGTDLHLQSFDYFYRKLRATINEDTDQYHLSLVGSCNGLVCFILDYKKFEDVPLSLLTYPIFVGNPITSEYVNLPRCGMKAEDFPVSIMCGIGYDESNNEFKVFSVRHNMMDLQSRPNRLQVYTLGDVNGWRNIQSPYVLAEEGIHIDGTIFWLDDEQRNIVAFDLADEAFELLPGPPFSNPRRSYGRLFILRRCLSVILVNELNVEVWLVKKKKGNDTKYNWSWKEFSVARVVERSFSCACNSRPITVSKSGEILFWDCLWKKLFLYNPKTCVTKEIVDKDVHKWEYCRSLPHMNSFVSLKALGEN